MNTEELIRNDLLRINQSKIKRVTSSMLCPQRYYLEEVTGELERYSSDAMLYGNYFEYNATGQLPRDGVIPIIPDLKKQRLGSYTPAVRQRLDQQIAAFPGIMAKYGIKIIKTGFPLEYQFNGEIIIHGITDCLVDWCGKPYVMDIKMTGNVHNTFGDFNWGSVTKKFGPEVLKMHPNKEGVYVATFEPENKEAMDFIQAHAYTYMMKKITSREWGFIYAVFDHKPESEHKIIEVLPEEAANKDMIERLQGTKAKLTKFKEMNYRAIPSLDECKGCKAKDCAVRLKQEDLLQPEDTFTVQANASIKAIEQAKSEPVESLPWE